MRLKSLTTIALALACLAAAGAAETKKDAQADTGPWPLVPEEQEILNFLRMNGGGEQGRDRPGHLTEVGVGVIQGGATLGEILTRRQNCGMSSGLTFTSRGSPRRTCKSLPA